MKRIMLTIVLLISIAMTAFGQEVKADTVAVKDTIQLNYDFGTNYNSLVKYLGVRKKDREYIKNAHKAFCDGMLMASKAKTVDERDMLIRNSIDYELNSMRIFLDEEQYVRFLIIFNYSLSNRGFSKFIK